MTFCVVVELWQSNGKPATQVQFPVLPHNKALPMTSAHPPLHGVLKIPPPGLEPGSLG